MKAWFLVGIGGLLLVYVLFAQPLTMPGGTGSVSSGGSDSNKVMVSSTDTLADFLFSKLQAGTGITLAVQNPGGDENILISATASAGDTNCAITNSCPNVAYTNTDENFLDLNATLLTVQDGSSAIKFKYGVSSKGLELPFPSACTEVFGVDGFANTGLQFCGGSLVGIGLPVLGSYNFFVFEGGTQAGSVYMKPTDTLADPSVYPDFAKGAVVQTRSDKDGNHIYQLLGPGLGFKQFHHSQYAPDFLFQTGDFNNTSDKNQLRFLGHVDFNGGIDVNQNSTFAQNVDIDKNLSVDGNIQIATGSTFFGNIEIIAAVGGQSCTVTCDALDGNTLGNYACIDSFTTAAGQAHLLCSNTTGTRNCICQN